MDEALEGLARFDAVWGRVSGGDGPSRVAAQDLAPGANADDGGPLAGAGPDGAPRFQSDAAGVGLEEGSS